MRLIPRPARGGSSSRRLLLFLAGLPAAALPLTTYPPHTIPPALRRAPSGHLSPSSLRGPLTSLWVSSTSQRSWSVWPNLLHQKSFLVGDVAPPAVLPSPDWPSPRPSPTRCSLGSQRGFSDVLVCVQILHVASRSRSQFRLAVTDEPVLSTTHATTHKTSMYCYLETMGVILSSTPVLPSPTQSRRRGVAGCVSVRYGVTVWMTA